MRPLSTSALTLVGVLACSAPDPTAPRLPSVAPSASLSPVPRDFVVMTQNIGPGANVDPILAATNPAEVPGLATVAFGQLIASDYPGRAQAVARLIRANAPALVGLQEVVLYRTQSPSDAIVGGTTPATTVLYDYLQLLLDDLEALGQHYTAVAQVTETDAEVPVYDLKGPPTDPGSYQDVRFTDRDVLLVRNDVSYTNARGALYHARISLSIGGPNAFVTRGWTSVDAKVGGATVRFISTHLEDQHSPNVQLAQAAELAKLAYESPYPVVVVGDLNSAANVRQTLTYPFLTTLGGLTDAWPIANPGVAGLTCCHPDELDETNPASVFDQRLDLVLLGDARSLPSVAGHDRLRDWSSLGMTAKVIGLRPQDRTVPTPPRPPLWPSDHAGVAATLRLSPSASH